MRLHVLGDSVKEEEIIEGMEAEEEEEGEGEEGEDGEKEPEYDEHVWLSLKNAKTKTVLFGDRFPFRYLVDDYGLDYYAAFVGCSAESETSFETISFLAGKVDQLKLSAICQIESSNGKIAETIKSTTKEKNQQILTFLGLINPLSGKISYGEDLCNNQIGYLPQQTLVQRDFPASVEEIVLYVLSES